MEGSASQAGFYYQNNIAALKIIECLFFESDIKEIRLENYDKGNHIDDIIIYREKSTDYFQIKWSESSENSYSLSSLLSSSEEKGKTVKKSLFKQLAEGYKSVRMEGKDFTIYLFTTKKEGSKKRPSLGLDHSLTEVRSKFFENVKKSDVRYDQISIYSEYKKTIDLIKEECDLDEDSFDDFIKKLDFRFNQSGIDQVQNAVRLKLDLLGMESQLLEKLLNAIVKWSITGERITKDILLKELGIKDRFEDKLSHFFKVVDDEFYVPNQNLSRLLNKALTELDGGYIFIEGLPGIGKSTALTKFKENHPDISLAYYCFIPDAHNNFGEARHKSYYFLKSLCISIEKNFSEVDLPNKYSERYEEKLRSYLEKLSTLQKKIIFIVDGLDHVYRDSAVGNDSLLNAISGELPVNIFFVLSSQFESVLSSSVRLLIASDSRRHIKVTPFTQLEIKLYLDNKGIKSDSYLDLIEKISGGIPIYLHYLSELFLKTSAEKYESILSDLPYLENGEINSYHSYLYQRIEDNNFERWVLAVLAYRKENTSTETIQQILKLAGEDRNVTEIENVISSFNHLLRQIEGRSYSVFHNSFREFIISKTEDLKEKFNKALILFYENAPHTDEASRNYFSHLFELGEYTKILENTTVEWMKEAWSNYRSLEEIEENLNIAVKACIEQMSLTDFTRVVFLKAQFDRIKWNLENSDISFHMLLLESGNAANSLRNVWDGDFISLGREAFCYYFKKYYLQTGCLLPSNITKQGLGKSDPHSGISSVSLQIQVKLLLGFNAIELLKEVDEISWHLSNEHDRSFLRKNNTDKENKRINLKIKFKAIDFLAEVGDFDKLFQLLDAYKDDKEIAGRINFCLVKLQLPLNLEKKAGMKRIKNIEFSTISNMSYLKFIAFCSNHLSDQEIRDMMPERILEPVLHNKVIEEKRMTYSLRKDILSLYDDMKALWIYNSDLASRVSLKTSIMTEPAASIYDSIFILSELWYEMRSGEMEEDEIIQQLEISIDHLCTYQDHSTGPRNHGLFDMNNDDYFISRSIKHLFKNIFNIAGSVLPGEKLRQLAEYWLKNYEKGYDLKHFSTALSIAEEISKIKGGDYDDLAEKIIYQAEIMAKEEKETASLTANLVQVSKVYGKCGFKNDFQRIYNQIFEAAFGLGHRKDYQASQIIEPMKLLHVQDPAGTLRRLSDVFMVQEMLDGVGNGRMQHICISELVKFTSIRYPELGFELMKMQEKNIDRSEALHRILEPLIDNCNDDELILYFTLIKTVIRTGDAGSAEGYFIDLSKKILLKAIHYKNKKIISKILQLVKYNAEVEKEELKELIYFSKLLNDNGIDCGEYSFPLAEKKSVREELKTLGTKSEKEREKFFMQVPKLSFEEIKGKFDEGNTEFNDFVISQSEKLIQNSRNQVLRKEYYAVKKLFQNFYDLLTPEHKKILDDNSARLIRNYINFKNRIISQNPERDVSRREINSFFSDQISEIDVILAGNFLADFTQDQLNLDDWLESIQHSLNWRNKYLFFKIIKENEIIDLTDQCLTSDLEFLAGFIDKWVQGKSRSVALIKIAHRLAQISPAKAKEIVSAVSNYEFDSVLFQNDSDHDKLDFDIFETILKIDNEFGKKFLLRSFIVHKGKYAGELTSAIHHLMKYKKHFKGDALQTYYDSNLRYNRELATGLQNKKSSKFDFIAEYSGNFTSSEIVIRHLVWLYGYPIFKIRELSLQSAFDLLEENPEHLDAFFKFGVENSDDNAVEYSLIVLMGIALKNPSLLLKFKKRLLSVLNVPHFNIREQAKELLNILHYYDNSLFSASELRCIRNCNKTSLKSRLNSKFCNLKVVICDWLAVKFTKKKKVKINFRKPVFAYSDFQKFQIGMLDKNSKNAFAVYDLLNDDICSKNLQNYNTRDELKVHRRYNMNTNFDTIEIYSNYYDELKSSINRAFSKGIKINGFESSFVENFKVQFRIYDPSKLLYSQISRPAYINWIIDGLSEEEFTRFSDFETLTDQLMEGDKNYVSLVQYGSQRISDTSVFRGTCYFEAVAFLKQEGKELPSLDPGEVLGRENQYAYEIICSSSNERETDFRPIIELSYNKFRGERDLVNANLVSGIFLNYEVQTGSLLDILCLKEPSDSKALRWINASRSDTDYRRLKPASEGFTLAVKKDLLLKYLRENNLTLCYRINLRRAAETYGPENRMKWFSLNRNVETRL